MATRRQKSYNDILRQQYRLASRAYAQGNLRRGDRITAIGQRYRDNITNRVSYRKLEVLPDKRHPITGLPMYTRENALLAEENDRKRKSHKYYREEYMGNRTNNAAIAANIG